MIFSLRPKIYKIHSSKPRWSHLSFWQEILRFLFNFILTMESTIELLPPSYLMRGQDGLCLWQMFTSVLCPFIP